MDVQHHDSYHGGHGGRRCHHGSDSCYHHGPAHRYHHGGSGPGHQTSEGCSHHGGYRGRGKRCGGSRARRGDIQAAILALLGEQDMHGYQIIQELSERSGGAWAPSPGSVYPTLQLLKDQGLVTSDDAEGRKVFSLTDAGRERVESLPEKAPWDAMVKGPGRELRENAGSLMAAVGQLGHTGTPEQIEQASEMLAETRKRIYRILAGDE